MFSSVVFLLARQVNRARMHGENNITVQQTIEIRCDVLLKSDFRRLRDRIRGRNNNPLRRNR